MEPAPTYHPQIDGLRTFAVLAVLIQHFWIETPAGHQGVRLFFVISGFLITSILLRARAAVSTSGFWSTATTFYARRALRIWPAYYVLISIAALLSFGDIRQTFAWHATYLSNWLIARHGWTQPSHLWTLSVEEQFYLAWPFLILLIPRNRLVFVLAALVVASLTFRGVLWAGGVRDAEIWVATPASIDALAVGGMLAIGKETGWMTSRLERPLRFSLIPLILFVAVDHKLQGDGFNYVFGELLSLAPAIVLVVGSVVGFRGVVGVVLGAPPIRFLGQISYGIYLYHPFAWTGASWSAERLNMPLPATGPVTFVVGTAATIAVAAFSWYALELPLNRLKARFRYGRSSRSDGERAFSPSAGATPT